MVGILWFFLGWPIFRGCVSFRDCNKHHLWLKDACIRNGAFLEVSAALWNVLVITLALLAEIGDPSREPRAGAAALAVMMCDGMT